jgi:hypothetical protein
MWGTETKCVFINSLSPLAINKDLITFSDKSQIIQSNYLLTSKAYYICKYLELCVYGN